MNHPTYSQSLTGAISEGELRAAFIRRTYTHLAGAVAAFVVVLYFLLQTSLPEQMLGFIGAQKYGWLMLLGGFMLIGWMARGLAAGTASVAAQYAGLGVYILAEAFLFLPMIYLAVTYSSPEVLPSAAICTGGLFAGLTAIVFFTKKNFSFLGPILCIGGFVALGAIVAGTIFGFNLGLLFSVIMVAFAGAAILYDTSKVLHEYPTDRHVGASLELFASVALLFWYILRIFMSRD